MKKNTQFEKSYFKLMEQQDLTSQEMSYLMKLFSEGSLNPAQASAILTALTIKGETSEEIYGAVKALSAKSVPIKKQFKAPVIDTCGTGGDKKSTFNISTIVALVLASLGIKVSKHGNRSITSKCGSADLLEGLGVNLDMSPEKISQCLKEVGIAFLFAPKLHPAFKHIMPIRKDLGFKTMFNILGPLLNPVKLDYQLIGVYDKKYVLPCAQCLQKKGVKRGAVFFGEDGMDEISLTTKTYVAAFAGDKISTSRFDPEKYGFRLCQASDLESNTLASNIKIAKSILSGQEKGPKRDIIIINAGFAYRMYHPEVKLKHAFEKIDDTLNKGLALKKLNELVDFSKG